MLNPDNLNEHIGNVWRAKCALDEAMVAAYKDGRLFIARLRQITGYSDYRIREIITRAGVSLDWNEAAPSPLAMPPRKSSHPVKPDSYALDRRTGLRNS